MSYGMKRADRIILGEKVTTRSNEINAQSFIQGTEIRDIGIARSGLPILGRNPRYILIDTSITGSITDKNYFIDTDSSPDAGLSQDASIGYKGTLYNSSGESEFRTNDLYNYSANDRIKINLTGLFIDGKFNHDLNVKPTLADELIAYPSLALSLISNASTYHPSLYTFQQNFLNQEFNPHDLHDLSLLGVSPSQINLLADQLAWEKFARLIFSELLAAETEIHKTTNTQTGLPEDTLFVKGTYSLFPTADVKFPDGKIKQQISFRRQSEEYGYGKEYIDTVPFFDMEKYVAIDYIRGDAPTGMMPIVGSFLSYDEKLSYNGIVEPFEIRSRALGLNTFAEGERQPGQITGDADLLPEHSLDSRENDYEAEYYEDVRGLGYTTLTQSEMLNFPNQMHDFAIARLTLEYVTDQNKNSYPFVERDNSQLLINDHGIEAQLLSMDSTVDEGILPEGHIDMAVGYAGHSRDRINSINYRGMLRR